MYLFFSFSASSDDSMEKENHPVMDLERYDPPLQFDDTAGVINIPTLAMCEKAMETMKTCTNMACI